MERNTQLASVAYIDEAGDEGFAFGPQGFGSSDWFVLAAIVLPGNQELEVVGAVKRTRESLGRGKDDPLHFRKLVHAKRRPWLRTLASLPARIAAVAIDKQRLVPAESFQGRARLYFKAVELLAAEISSLAAAAPAGSAVNGPLQMVFSNRESLSQHRLASHLFDLRRAGAPGINWEILDPAALKARPHRQVAGLQVADAVASALFMSLNRNAYGDKEAEYLELLSPLRTDGHHPWPLVWPPPAS